MKKFTSSIAILILTVMTISGQSSKIDNYVEKMDKKEGFFTFYSDNNSGKIFLEVETLGEEFLFISSVTGGLGSNNIGLDRNRLGSTKIVSFKKYGPKLMLVEPNYGFRAKSSNLDEIKAVSDAFAISVIHSFTIVATQGERYLIDVTPLLYVDLNSVSDTFKRSKQGDFKIDQSRSAIYSENTKNFPLNSEFESLITFSSSNPGNYVRSVAPDPKSVTLRQHLSFVNLPDDNYTPRVWDPRSGFGAISYMDFAAPVDESITKRFIRRHRLEKKDPTGSISDPVEPIIYYVDRGAPEPIRSALVEGASWWNQAFEAAGYKNAFQVKVLPEGADPMDIRYNMINWVHRSTRGWSYGSSVTDPRTGEIIKGHIALGSQRIRQDFLIASGLVAEYNEGAKLDPAIMELALLRIKQLSCHEVGHTLGLNHNYAASANGRASVMDYPHPLIKLDGENIDLSDVYTNGIGDWDKVTIKYGYSDFSNIDDEVVELRNILDTAFEGGQIFLTDQDSRGTHPLTHVWDNGAHPTAELLRVMKIRKIALDNFSEKKIPVGVSMSVLEEILVPIYLFHRYQIQAAASAIGGLYYNHNVRGGTQELPKFVPADEQYASLDALLEVIEPKNLAIDEKILEIIPPRAPGLRQSPELFPGRTGLIFDPLSAAENIASLTASALFNNQRAARLVLFASRDQSLPTLDNVIEKVLDRTIYARERDQGMEEIQRTVNTVILNHLIILAANPENSPQVRAVAHLKLFEVKEWLTDRASIDFNKNAHHAFLLGSVEFYMENPDRVKIPKAQVIPAGAPIGSY